MARRILLLALAGCGSDGTFRSADGGAGGRGNEAEAEGADDGGTDDAGAVACVAPCTSPPPPSCHTDPKTGPDPCRALAFDAAGTCRGGACVYPSRVLDCPFGCDAATGACRAPDDCCARDCGWTHECGGVCDSCVGCAMATAYTVSSGFTSSGAVVCCEGEDARTGISDCGDGDNHWVSPVDPNCGAAYEGDDNYGGPCVSLACEGRECVVAPCGD